MKAAVIFQQGDVPQYTNYPDPVPQKEHEALISMKAAAIKHIDRSRASGHHYTAGIQSGAGTIPGGDGVGLLADGTRVYAIGISGMLAERAVADKRRMVAVPHDLDDITAAALPNAVIGAAMALRFKADMKAGDTVLINGATGFTGKVAVQIAKRYGAQKIIATRRNEQTLQMLLSLGADEVISLEEDDAAVSAAIRSLHEQTPINVVIDYLWGHSAEMILAALKGNGAFSPHTRFVSVGAVTGDLIQLSAAALRSIDLQLSGSGLGSWTKAQVGSLFSEILPEMFRLAARGELKTDTLSIPLKDVASLWDREILDGKRVVVTI